MKKQKIEKSNQIIIAKNKRAKYQYFIKEEFEAGIVLKGWETKSLRVGKANISDSYIIFNNREIYLFGANFQPLIVASSHITYDPTRTRKLLLNKKESNFIYNQIHREGHTAIALSLYCKNPWIKVTIGIAKGKKAFDKRINIKNREWGLDKARIIKRSML